MKPRVFVSSIFYDLKHVRERLERFIEAYNFEPVLFESDKVLFEHNKPLDASCYNEVKLCHIMILIIGGRYGSIASGENHKDKMEKYNKEYVSVTRKEYETALKMNIPVFIFVDKNVSADYQTFKKNKSLFENSKTTLGDSFRFAHVDDINIFNFISLFHEKPIKTFERVDEIENYISNQIAGMLYLYLQQLQSGKKEEKILDSVAELQSIVERMNTMLEAVGKNVITDNSLEEVIFNQNKILIDYFVNQFGDNIHFKNDYYEVPNEVISEVFQLCKNTLFDNKLIFEADNEKDWSKKWDKVDAIKNRFNERLILTDENVVIESFDYRKIWESFTKNIYPIISKDKTLESFFEEKIIYELGAKISRMPFY